MANDKKVALIILDGWGHGKNPKASAIVQGRTPFVDSLYKELPHNELITFGENVGLPEGQMGNSEVGHLNIGAGRIVYQELTRISKSIREGEMAENEVLLDAITYAEKNHKAIHLMGLLSDGGVHSHIDHVKGLTSILSTYDVNVKIHAFLDGRDTDPNGGKAYVADLENHIKGSNSQLVSIIGRYYAMDRDNRWERIARAYQLIVNGKGSTTDNFGKSLQKYYDDNVTDEFMEPIIKEGFTSSDLIKNGDVVIFFNFRTDRPRQLTIALTQKDFPEHDMHKLDLHFCTMTKYHKDFKGINVIFTKEDLVNTLGEVLSKQGKTQVRIAETEKYPHVTFFFSGGREKEFDNESRILVNSPKVATYDLQPEMSAPEVTSKLRTFIDDEEPDFVCINYANADMVGHTGVMEAAIKAVETVDNCLSDLVSTLKKHHYSYIIIADHGNADIMFNEDGSPHTAHTTNMVPIFIGGDNIDPDNYQIKDGGKLGDIATTILSIMGIAKPEEMTGENLLMKK